MNNEDQSLKMAMMFERLSPTVQEKLLEVLREMAQKIKDRNPERSPAALFYYVVAYTKDQAKFTLFNTNQKGTVTRI